MKFNLRKPCANCPFRTDLHTNYGWLSKARAEEISESMKEKVFPCHNTTISSDYDDDGEEIYISNPKEQACFGAIVTLHQEGKLFDNQMIQIAIRLGLYKGYKNINTDLPIVSDRQEFIAMHTDSYMSKVRGFLVSMSAKDKAQLVSTYQLNV